jgi:predicted RNA-binding protein with TRAM domain
MKKNDVVTLEITDMSSEGSGVAHLDGLVVFVPMTAVGDVVRVKIVKAKKNIAAFGLEDKITLRLFGGLSGLKKGEAEEIIIAGMGGNIISEILKVKMVSSYGMTEHLWIKPSSQIHPKKHPNILTYMMAKFMRNPMTTIIILFSKFPAKFYQQKSPSENTR